MGDPLDSPRGPPGIYFSWYTVVNQPKRKNPELFGPGFLESESRVLLFLHPGACRLISTALAFGYPWAAYNGSADLFGSGPRGGGMDGGEGH